MVNIGRVIAILAILGFSLLVHITNGALHNEQIGFANPMDFDTVLIIPLDHAANRFASIQHNHHGCASLHLLDVVKALGVRLIRRSRLSTLGTLAHLVLDFRKWWTNQFTVHLFNSLDPHDMERSFRLPRRKWLS